jgi:2-hydroxychromene-2-carboxylate isomerase
MPHIDYYMSPLSPYVYLTGDRPAEIAARHGATLAYKPIDPAALFARTGGLKLPDRHQSRQDYRLQELRRQSTKLDLPLNVKPRFWPANGAPAAYAIIAAQAAGGGDITALVTSFSRACWEEERDIADDDVIRACLTAAGFEAGLAFSGMLAGAEIYGRNLESAVNNGVFGMPFFVVQEERFWGQDRLEDLELHLAGLH